ncbi:putative pentatricopeptide repeat-containing protein [Platanthera guangdongensis]|uniref:Pentatricopeptide repeat-containing protein n=1 Tax=Platanthera guangdongensis TaxID=2320717 RepID=A0ABR2ME42_9ASPA
MMRTGADPLNFTTISSLSSSSSSRFLGMGSQIHYVTSKVGLDTDISVSNSLIAMYGECGRVPESWKIFMSMLLMDDVSWNSMVASYVQKGLLSKALDLVWLMMHNDQKMDCFTFTTVLSACSFVEAVERGMEIHALGIRSQLKPDVFVESSLVYMYSKCGRIDYASTVFRLMPVKNEYSWNAMIAGCARHGQGRKELELFNDMRDGNLEPDHVTFVGVLSACNHACLVEEGMDYFESMTKKHGLVPWVEHYSCVVDLLGRAGEIDRMEEFLKKMPVSPNGLIWRTVLGVCCRSQNGTKTNLVMRASKILVELEPHNPVNYVLISNLYASKGRWEGVVKARISLRGSREKKETGGSWVALRNEVHIFRCGDRSHPERMKIYEKMEFLREKMKEMGYIPRTEFAWYDLEAEGKEEVLSYHIERLAVAFILTRSSWVPIRIMKNLRVCGDCHIAFCYISKIVGRQIVLSDYIRFHHFVDGRRSCVYFW